MAPSHSPQREHTCSDHRSPLSRTWGAQPQQGDRQELNQKLLKKRTRRLIEVTSRVTCSKFTMLTNARAVLVGALCCVGMLCLCEHNVVVVLRVSLCSHGAANSGVCAGAHDACGDPVSRVSRSCCLFLSRGARVVVARVLPPQRVSCCLIFLAYACHQFGFVRFCCVGPHRSICVDTLLVASRPVPLTRARRRCCRGRGTQLRVLRPAVSA